MRSARRLSSRPKWDEHWHPARVLVVWDSELLTEKFLLETRFDVDTARKHGRAGNRHIRHTRERGRDDGQQESRVDRMPHHRVRTRVDNVMMFLTGDRAGPEPAEMKTRPPR